MEYSIGVDIGGTKVAIAIVNQLGEVITETVIPTDLTIKPEEMIRNICEEIKNVVATSSIEQDEIIGIGIGAPGPLDSKNGMITCPPNLKTWIDIPIRKLVEQTFSIPVIDPSFGQCSCGQYGCLESIASGTAIAKRASEIVGKDLSTKEVFDLYADAHPAIVEYIESVFKVLGIACVSIINTVDPEMIVIGGGVSKVGDPLFHSIQKYVSQFALNPIGRNTKIVPAKLDQSSGVIGAAALCFVI